MAFKNLIAQYLQNIAARITSKTDDYSISETDIGSSFTDLGNIVGNAVNGNAESRLYDLNYNVYRDFISTAEIDENVPDDVSRDSGNIYYVNSGGTITAGIITGGTRTQWWYVNRVITLRTTGIKFTRTGTIYMAGNPLGLNGTTTTAGQDAWPVLEPAFFQSANVVVRANNPATITLPTAAVSLVGIATKGSSAITSVVWTLDSKPTGAANPTFGTPAIVTDSNGNQTNTTALTGLTTAGNYGFRFTATDGNGSPYITVIALVNAAVNTPPTIDAINPVTMHLSNSVTSQAVTAVPHQGTNGITISWSQISGPTSGVTITNGTTATATFNGLDTGGTANYVFRCSVTDGSTTVHSDVTLHVVVDAAVITNTGEQTIQLPANTGTLTKTVTQGSYPIVSQVWSFASGPVTAAVNASSGAVTGMTTAGDYVFLLTVTDSKGNPYTATETMHQTAAAVIFYFDFFNSDPTYGDTADVTAINFTQSVALSASGATWIIANAFAGNGKWFGGKIVATEPTKTIWDNDHNLNQGSIPDQQYKPIETISGNKYLFSRDVITISPSIPQLSFS
jgi:hypothetical protein